MSELYLIRHAQASLGAENYDQLSPLGFQQSRWLGEYFAVREMEFDLILCGSMLRHRQTLEGAFGASIKDRLMVLPELNEYDFMGLVKAYLDICPDDEDWRLIQAGRTSQAGNEIQKKYFRLLYKALLAWSENKLDDVPETWNAFVTRVQIASDKIRTELVDNSARVLAVSSGGAISAFIGHVMDLSPATIFDLNLQVRNSAINHFFFNRQKFNLAGFNAVPHLEIAGRESAITYG